MAFSNFRFLNTFLTFIASRVRQNGGDIPRTNLAEIKSEILFKIGSN